MAMLEVKNLEVYYGVIQAIKGISFEDVYKRQELAEIDKIRDNCKKDEAFDKYEAQKEKNLSS